MTFGAIERESISVYVVDILWPPAFSTAGNRKKKKTGWIRRTVDGITAKFYVKWDGWATTTTAAAVGEEEGAATDPTE